MATARQHQSNARQPDELPKTGLITVREAAGYLAMSECKIYEMSQQGILPSVKIGRSRRFKLGDLDDYISKL